MILFLVVTAIYTGLLVAIRPASASLKAPPISYAENFRSIRASLGCGFAIALIFLFSSHLSFFQTDVVMLDLFAFTGRFDSAKVWQPLTHLLLHFDLLHLLSNLGLLGLLTVYERRVGHARYLAVLAVAGLASIPSVWMYSEPVLVCGISGGLLGLAAAYFTDHKELSRREWAVAVVVFLALFLILSLIDEIRTGGPGGAAGPLSYQIDHIGHLLGAAAGLVYCRLRPRD